MIKNIRIKRAQQGKWIKGVISGISKEYELNPNVIRVILIILTLIAPYLLIIFIPSYIYAFLHMKEEIK